MKTMMRMSATGDAQVRASRFDKGADVYEDVVLDTNDPGKLIPFVDQLLALDQIRGQAMIPGW
jgi:hypothetical protein